MMKAALTRRTMMLGTAAISLAACATPDVSFAETSERIDFDRFIIDITRQPDETLSIWPEQAPGRDAVDLTEHIVERQNSFGLPDRAALDVTAPTLSYFRSENFSGNTILLIPGGGYQRVVVEKEGWEGARYFNQFGYDVYVMTYRLPFQGWPSGADTPLQDAQRAMRVLRGHSANTHGSETNVLAIGFSAGGHLAGSLNQRFADTVYDPVDVLDDLSAEPDITALVYPVVLMGSEHTHAGSQNNLLGDDPTEDQLRAYDLTRNVNPDSPPLFLLHALDDTSVVMENSMELMNAYRDADVPAVLHIFEHGGHGFGMRGIENTPLEDWPGLLMNWAAENGLPPTPR